MSPEITQTLFPIIESIGIATFAGVLAVFITNRLNIDRERISGIRTRKRAFLAFLESWKHEIGRTYLVSGGFDIKESVFKDVVSSFIYESRLIKCDFPVSKRKGFDDLCVALIGWNHKGISCGEENEKAQKEIDDLIAFVEKNSI